MIDSLQTAVAVLKNSFFNLVAAIAQRIGQTVVFIFIARLLLDSDIGSYKLASTYTSILLAFSFWGLDQLFIREVARHRDQAGRYLSGFFGLRVGFAVLLWVGLALLLPFLPYEAESKRLILIMSLSIIPSALANLYQSVWMALEDVRLISIQLAAISVVRMAGGVALIWWEQPLIAVAWWFLVMAIVEMGLNIWLTRRHHDLSGAIWRIDLAFWRRNLRIATPLIILSIVLTAEHQFDVLILSFFQPEAEVGVYGLAITLLTLMLFVTRSYQLAIFPVISRAFKTGPAALRAVYVTSNRYVLPAALLVTLAIFFLSDWLIRIVYGPGNEAAAQMLRVLSWVFAISAFNISNSRLMIAADKQTTTAYFALASLTANILLSLWLVPRYGGLGTAWAKVLSMPFYSIPCFLYVQRYVRDRHGPGHGGSPGPQHPE
jgi:O-antigen/teichoic acid export membrane protein